jgi:hypothetical protein
MINTFAPHWKESCDSELAELRKFAQRIISNTEAPMSLLQAGIVVAGPAVIYAWQLFIFTANAVRPASPLYKAGLDTFIIRCR